MVDTCVEGFLADSTRPTERRVITDSDNENGRNLSPATEYPCGGGIVDTCDKLHYGSIVVSWMEGCEHDRRHL